MTEDDNGENAKIEIAYCGQKDARLRWSTDAVFYRRL